MIYNDAVSLNGIKQDLYFLGKFNAGTFNQNDLNRIINKYYLQVQMAIRQINEDFYAVPNRTDLQIGQNYQYSYPIDMEKMKFIEIAIQPLSLTAPLRSEFVRATLVTSDQITTPGYTFSGPTVIMYGDYFEVVNNVTGKVIGGMRMVYIPKQVQMSADSDVPNVVEDYQDCITWGTLIDISPRLNNTELLTQAMGMYKKRMADLKDNLSNRIQDLSGSYVEGQTAEGGWNYPFGNTGGYR